RHIWFDELPAVTRPAPPTTPPPPEVRYREAATERERIQEALQRCSGNQTRAAKLLGIARGTLTLHLSAYDRPLPRQEIPSIGRASDDGGASKLALAITPAVQDFVAPVGTTSEAVELSVTNSGDQPLGPLSFSIKGPAQADFALVQACPSLLGGGSCDVTLT